MARPDLPSSTLRSLIALSFGGCAGLIVGLVLISPSYWVDAPWILALPAAIGAFVVIALVYGAEALSQDG